MSNEPIEGMLEVVEGLVVPELALVEDEAAILAKKFTELWDAVYNDDQTIRISHKFVLEGRAKHRTVDNMHLVLRRTTKSYKFSDNSKKKTKRPTDVRSMGVSDADGDMFVALNLLKVPLDNLTDDPFADLIMDYFSRHLES